MPSLPAIRPPGFAAPVVPGTPDPGIASGPCVTAPERVPVTRTQPALAPQQPADAKPVALNHVASPTGQILTRLPPAASVARAAYLTAQDNPPRQRVPRGKPPGGPNRPGRPPARISSRRWPGPWGSFSSGCPAFPRRNPGRTVSLLAPEPIAPGPHSPPG